jgi:CBS domain containing-hemolysin-like protein
MAIEKPINSLHNQLTKLRNYKKAIMASNKTPEEKREAIDKLNRSENNMLNNIKDLNRRAVEINKS